MTTLFITRTDNGRRALETQLRQSRASARVITATIQGVQQIAGMSIDAAYAIPGAFDDMTPSMAGHWRDELRCRLAPTGGVLIDLGEVMRSDLHKSYPSERTLDFFAGPLGTPYSPPGT